MHATLKQSQSGDPVGPIRGTFYPSGRAAGDPSIGAALPKVLAILVAMAVLRNVVANVKRHGGAAMSSRRREAIAELHRTLHASEAAQGTKA